MKKKVPILFIVATLICIAIYVGVFIGRRQSHNFLYLHNAVEQVEAHRTNKDYIIDINTASSEELMMLPGMTRPAANAIVEYREKYGNYILVSELKKIKGITNEMYNSIKDYVTVDDPT